MLGQAVRVGIAGGVDKDQDAELFGLGEKRLQARRRQLVVANAAVNLHAPQSEILYAALQLGDRHFSVL